MLLLVAMTIVAAVHVGLRQRGGAPAQCKRDARGTKPETHS